MNRKKYISPETRFLAIGAARLLSASGGSVSQIVTDGSGNTSGELGGSSAGQMGASQGRAKKSSFDFDDSFDDEFSPGVTFDDSL